MGKNKFAPPKTKEEFLNNSGDVLADKQKLQQEWTNFTLRIRKDLLAEIDKVLIERPGMVKTVWILEAIYDKLKKCRES